MIYIILSIFCSVTVAVLLKLAKRYHINIIQAVTTNYFVASILCYLFYKPDIKSITAIAPWPIYISLAILLPTIFFVLATSVKKLGIVKTDIAQRISLCIPILAAYFLFNENFNTLKFVGIGIGFLAIILTFARPSQKRSNSTDWIYPVLVFVGFGVIDVLFKQIALYKEIHYTTSLFAVFCLAFVVSLIIVWVLILTKKIKLQLVNIVCGLILGLFNFANILFYLKAHQALAQNPSTVFTAMNLGVIAVGSLIGVIIFKEKLSKLNLMGIGLAICAVIIIALSQFYVI